MTLTQQIWLGHITASIRGILFFGTRSWASEGFFPGGGQYGIFSNFFPEGAKSGEIWFLPLEIEKRTLFANNFKIQGRAKAPPAPFPTPMNQILCTTS